MQSCVRWMEARQAMVRQVAISLISISLAACGGGSDSPAPAPMPTVLLSANPTSIVSGNSTTLTWSSTDATSCVASGAWSGAKATSGNQSTGALTTASAFTLTCTGAGGSANQSVNVDVQPIPTPAPTVLISANPLSVVSGNSATLTWSTTNATSCAASGAWTGAVPTSGSQSTGALNNAATFSLTCIGPGGSASNSATVNILPIPMITLSASPTSVISGGQSTLTWSTTDATSCTASGDWNGAKSLNGNQSTNALTTTSSFTLTCVGAGGSASQTVIVTVLPVPTVSLSANPIAVIRNGASTLNWSSTNASSCIASGAWSGAKATSGSQSTGALTSAASYTLTCSSSGGSASQTAVVDVLPLPTITLSANPTSVISGAASTLTWSTTNATACAASGSWSGTKATSGNQSTGAITTNSTFTLTCNGAGGSASQSVTVTVATGSATVSWLIPSTNADGTTLSDLSGFRIHYGTSPGNYTSVIDIPNASATSYVINGLSSGTYYFAVGAYDTSNNESALSTEVNKTL